MNNVPLTSEDRVVILEYAARLEKRSCHWRVLRWLSVGCFIFGLGLLLAVDRVAARMRSTLELPPNVLKISDNAGAKSLESSLELIVAHEDARLMALRAELLLYLKALIVAGVGTALFVYAVSDWRRDRRDKVVAKLLRSVASSDTVEQEHGS
jgi:hypothetical protein